MTVNSLYYPLKRGYTVYTISWRATDWKQSVHNQKIRLRKCILWISICFNQLCKLVVIMSMFCRCLEGLAQLVGVFPSSHKVPSSIPGVSDGFMSPEVCKEFISIVMWQKKHQASSRSLLVLRRNSLSSIKIMNDRKRLNDLLHFSKDLLTIYRKYCNLIGYRTRYLSGDR